jgi:hypothetical protein
MKLYKKNIKSLINLEEGKHLTKAEIEVKLVGPFKALLENLQ